MGGNRSRMHNGNDSRRYYDWLEHSSQDLIAAKILSEDDRCYRLSAFHCQQAIEKALKAYILLKSDVLVDGFAGRQRSTTRAFTSGLMKVQT